MDKKISYLPTSQHPDTTPLLTIDELTLYFKGKYSDKTLQRWRLHEGMPAIRIGRRYWYSVPKVMDWIQRRFN